MIKKSAAFGTLEDVVLVEFGKGTVMVSSAKTPDDSSKTYMCFKTTEPKPIGSTWEESIGKRVEDIGADIVMVFDNVDSIDVVMRSLIECRKNLQP